MRPPGRVTRTISLATSKGVGANMAPKMLTTRSNVSSASSLRLQASPSWNRRFGRPCSCARRFPASTRLRAMSTPSTSAPRRAAGSAVVPSPQPRSSTLSPGLTPRLSTTASPLSRMLCAMRVKSPFSQSALFGFMRAAPSSDSRLAVIYPIRRGAARVRVARRASPATATGGGPSPAPRVPRQARGPPVRSLTMRPPHLHNGYANRESETPAAVLRYPISATAAENPCPVRAEEASQAGRRRFDPGRPLSLGTRFLLRQPGLAECGREGFTDLRPHESGEFQEAKGAEGRLQLQKPPGEYLRFFDAAGHGERRSLQRVKDAEAWVGLYRLREACGCVVVAPEAKPHGAQGDITFVAQGIEGTEAQRPVRIVFGEHRVAAPGMDVRAPIERGGAGAVQRQCAGDGARRRLEIVGEMQDGESRIGERRGIVGAEGKRQSCMAHALGPVGLVEARAAEAALTAHGQGRMGHRGVGVEHERLLELAERDGRVFGHGRLRVRQGAEIEVIGAEILWALAPRALDFRAANARSGDPG